MVSAISRTGGKNSASSQQIRRAKFTATATEEATNPKFPTSFGIFSQYEVDMLGWEGVRHHWASAVSEGTSRTKAHVNV